MSVKDDIDNFNNSMAKKLGYSIQKSLMEKGLIKKGDGENILNSYILRMLTFYSSININDICIYTKDDKIMQKEIEIEFETFVTQPEVWEQWKRRWDYQKPLHDNKWLKKVLEEEQEVYDESKL